MSTPLRLELPRWYDLHAHFRQDELVAPLVEAHIAMGCAGILAMPNTKPPVSRVFATDDGNGWSVETYQALLKNAAGRGLQHVIVPLYLTNDTTPTMIEEGAHKGLLRACKYYPPHGTTGAEAGAPFETYMKNGVFKAMEEAGVILCIHGEEHDLPAETWFGRAGNAEEIFYERRLPAAVGKFPKLKIVGEHVTTKKAVEFIKEAPDTVAATITPQHLLYTVGHLLKGLKSHLYCLPVLKFEEDRIALRAAVTKPGQSKFFAGTDSAPHANKLTQCGCAAGCFTGGIAPQLYAQAFEEAEADLGSKAGQEALKRFLCLNGPAFYDLPVPAETFILEKMPGPVLPVEIGPERHILSLPLGLAEGGERVFLPWRLA
ncbi:MAG: dihydroorotase [Alphaproteobacteria bacterium]